MYLLLKYLNLLESEIDSYMTEQDQNGSNYTGKSIKEFDSVQFLDLGCDQLYLVTGKKKIFHLGDGDDWARELTETEIQSLPYDIYWTGPDVNFEADSRRATELSKEVSFYTLNY